MTKEALNLALEALMEHEGNCELNKEGVDRHVKAIAAIKEALAQPAPVQEPVAWMEMVVANLVREGVNKHNARELAEHFYTAPSAAQREWVGLTDGVMCDIAIKHGLMSIDWIDFARDIEQASKEKNT